MPGIALGPTVGRSPASPRGRRRVHAKSAATSAVLYRVGPQEHGRAHGSRRTATRQSADRRRRRDGRGVHEGEVPAPASTAATPTAGTRRDGRGPPTLNARPAV